MQSLAGPPVIDVSLAMKQGLIMPVWFPLDKLNCVTRAGCHLPRWPWFVCWWVCFLIGSGRSPQLRVIFCVNSWRFTTRSSCFDERRGKSREEIYYGCIMDHVGCSFFTHCSNAACGSIKNTQWSQSYMQPWFCHASLMGVTKWLNTGREKKYN